MSYTKVNSDRCTTFVRFVFCFQTTNLAKIYYISHYRIVDSVVSIPYNCPHRLDYVSVFISFNLEMNKRIQFLVDNIG